MVRRRAQRRAVVVIGAPIPRAVPGALLQSLRPVRGALPIRRGLLADRLCDSAQTRQSAVNVAHRNQPSQTLSPRPSMPTRFMPSFQSPLPINGRPCAPAVAPLSNGPPAMFVERIRFGWRSGTGRSAPSRPARSGAPVRNGTRSSRIDVVAGGRHVVRRDKRQPQQIVGAARAHAAPGRRMPPVQHVPGLELMLRGLQDVFAARCGAAWTSAITSCS